MFLRRVKELRAEVRLLHELVNTLLEEVDTLKAEREREVYVNEDGERVPMAQVINEYLYGKEENA